MEEKERYEIVYFDNDTSWKIIDNKTKQEVGGIDDMIKLLNQQDNRIKELENMNNRLSQGIYWGNGEHFCDVVKRYKSENEQLKQQLEETKQNCNYQVMLMCSKENILLNQQLKQAQNKKAIEELEGLQVQCQFSITFADYTQEQRLYDYINDRIKELKGVDIHA